MSLHSAPRNLDALPIFRLCRLFVAPMVCTAPIFRYSPHYRICYHRLHTYSKICRSSICAPPSLALFIRRANSTVPRMQAPFSGGFRMLAALRSPLSISAHCAAFGVRFISCQRALPLIRFTRSGFRITCDTHGNQCKQITAPLTQPPILLGISHIRTRFSRMGASIFGSDAAQSALDARG